jgi:regulator of protease activity HflC (stomatin/prohibitin superfamily)
LVAALVLGTNGAIRGGSSPLLGTNKKHPFRVFFIGFRAKNPLFKPYFSLTKEHNMCYNIYRRLGVLAKAKKDVCSLKPTKTKIMETIGYIILCAIFLMAYFYGFSFTEWGPFTQLPSGRRLDVKVGKSNVVRYYLNEPGYGIDERGNIYEDKNGKYLTSLKRNFVFRYFGMVYTGIPFIPVPFIGGVIGSEIFESALKVSKDATGVIIPSLEKLEPVYHTAPPIFIKQGLVLSGIPIKGSNLVEFGFSYTLRVTNVHGYQYRTGEPTTLVGDNFESMLRPYVATMESVEEVQKMSSESGGDAEQYRILQNIIEKTNESLKKYGYGCEIYEMNLPIVQPTGALAEAVRKQELNEAERLADIPKVAQNTYRTIEEGKAKGLALQEEAKGRRAIADATKDNPWVNLEEGIKNADTVVLGQGIMNSLPIKKEKR